MPRPSYTYEKMDRQLRAGNVGEAIFRLWYDERAGYFPQVSLIQQGYNPEGIIPVGDKREQLMKKSDPDFALVSSDQADPQLAPRIVGISINCQRRPYDRLSTMGGYCIKCPRAHSCYDGHEQNIWYNSYNIENDYPQFRERFGGADVVLVTLFLDPTTIYKWIQQEGLEDLLLTYIYAGRAGIEGHPRAEELLRYLAYGKRKGVRRKARLVWLLHSEIAEGKVPWFQTGGQSQYGRPRMVHCVDMKAARDEDAFKEYLAGLGGKR